MGELWLAGAENRQRYGGLGMDGGPPRVVHHITYDSLRSSLAGDEPAVASERYADGSVSLAEGVSSCIPGLDEWVTAQTGQSVRGERIITLDGVTNYLLDKHYVPHAVIDPFDGRMICCLPANEGGFALKSGNRTGDVCYQIEWFFTPGTNYGGVVYDQLYDTPMGGLAEVMDLADSWGIPRVAPLSPGDRNSGVWANVAGHYGHFNVPGNDHSDPVCSIQSILDHAVSQPDQPDPPALEDLPVEFIAASPDNATGYHFNTGTRPWTRTPIPTPAARDALSWVLGVKEPGHRLTEEKGIYGPLDPNFFNMFTEA